MRNIVETKCYSLGILNGNLGYFFYNRTDDTPEILRTTCKKDINKIRRAIFETKPFRKDALDWIKSNNVYNLDDSIIIGAEKDAEIIRFLSRNL